MIVCLPKMGGSNRIGGGWSFIYNFMLGGLKTKLYDTTECVTGGDWDVCLVPAPTMCDREQFKQMIDMTKSNRPPKPKKVILRVDGVPEDFRNRGTGWPRLRDYARQVDGIIYQSQFTKDTIGRLLKKDGAMIYNGVDTSVFKAQGDKFPEFGNPSILCVNYRNDPNKRVQEVIERFRYYKLDNPGAKITFVGSYPKKQFLWNQKSWDFGMLDLKQNEDWQYMGGFNDSNQMAKVMRSCDYIAFPSFAEPCSNTFIEALCSGCEPLWLNDYGSTVDVAEKYKNGYDFSFERMCREYFDYFQSLV